MTSSTLKDKGDFRHLLSDILAQTENQTAKNRKTPFFHLWFRQHGKAYYFLFKKNLSRTNIQFAELLRLVESHLTWATPTKERLQNLQIASIQEFLSGFETLDKELNKYYQDKTNQDRVLDLYEPMLKRLVLFETFFGSCSVFIPPHLRLDLKAVCAASGYIHSCGQNIFTRPLAQIAYSHMQAELEEYLTQSETKPAGKKQIFFTPYAHEDFTDYDRDLANELKGGLDDVKVHLEKYSIKDDTLVSALVKLKSDFAGRLYIPAPGDFRSKHLRDPDQVETDRTIWLILDRGLGKEFTFPGAERFLICYAQDYLNADLFQIFDENKPAWVNHTTLPHSLAAAMINITRPWRSHNVTLFDPFLGSGTILLEGLKQPGITASGADRDSISRILVNDNLTFFGYDADNLTGIYEKLRSILDFKLLPEPEAYDSRMQLSEYREAIRLYEIASKDARDGDVCSENVVPELEKSEFFVRLVFYICLRASIRHYGGFIREGTTWTPAFRAELSLILAQTKRLIQAKELEAKARLRSSAPAEIGEAPLSPSVVSEVSGKYSIALCCNSEYLRHKIREIDNPKIVMTRNILTWEAQAHEKYDLIVTDPPYGMNTKEENQPFEAMYAILFKKLVTVLKDDAQIVLSLPEVSYSGRDIPYFVHPSFVVQHLLCAAQEQQFLAFRVAEILPSPSRLFKPPYYWESERALRRSILHFRFLKQTSTPY